MEKHQKFVLNPAPGEVAGRCSRPWQSIVTDTTADLTDERTTYTYGTDMMNWSAASVQDGRAHCRGNTRIVLESSAFDS